MSDLNDLAERVRKDAERKQNETKAAEITDGKPKAADILKSDNATGFPYIPPTVSQNEDKTEAAAETKPATEPIPDPIPEPKVKEVKDDKEEEDEAVPEDLGKPLPMPKVDKFEKVEEESVVLGKQVDDDDDDEPTVIMDAPKVEPEEASDSGSKNLMSDEEFFKDDDSIPGIGVELEMPDEMIMESMPNIPAEQAEPLCKVIRKEVMDYRQQLMLKNGLPSEEANSLAMSKMKKLASDKDIAYLKENPSLLTITVKKEDSDNLEFTEEEKKKIEKVKVIKLEEIENKEIATTKVKRFNNKRDKLAFLQKLDGPAIATYSVPLPGAYDFISFKGTQLIQLLQSVRYEDSSYDEAVSKKAGLIYQQMINGSHLRKTDADGKGILSFTDFTKRFLFHDLDMALFGVFVASSVEEVETPMACADCRQNFTWKWNVKEVLDPSDMPDEYKARMDDILKNKSNGNYLRSKYEDVNQTKVVRSTVTNYIYWLNAPSVERVVRLFQTVNQQDETMVYLSAISMFIEKMEIPIKNSTEFVEITEEEPDIILDQMQIVPQDELELISKFIQPMYYQAKFTIKSKCPHCGYEMSNSLSVEELVFLLARGSSTETR